MDWADKKSNTAYIVIFLIAAVFASHFLLINQFGLYEDDYAGSAYINGEAGISDALKAGYRDKARPVGRALRYTLNYVGSEAGGLAGMYVIGFIIIALNTVLTFLVIRRVAPDYVATVGALVFCLYPADTTKILLTHSLQIQPAFTFSLLGILMYQKGRRIVPYALSLLALLTYETALLPFLAAPLLTVSRQKLIKPLVVHVSIAACLVAAVLAARLFLGEARVSAFEGLGFLEMLGRIGAAVVIGPMTSAAMFFYRPLTAISEGGIGAYLLMAAFFVVVFTFLRKNFDWRKAGHGERPESNGRSGPASLAVNADDTRVSVGGSRGLLVAGVILWCASYVFAFSNAHWPPVDISGRLTSVHIAATFAAALTIAGLVWQVRVMFREHPGRMRYITGILSAYLALLAGFSYVVQEDYARSWQYQKEFWSRLIELTPDLDVDKVIWIGGRSQDRPERTKYVKVHSWADRIVLSGIYDYKKKMRPRMLWPRMDIATTGFIKAVREKGDKVYYVSPRTDLRLDVLAVDPDDIIVLQETKDGRLMRFVGRLARESFDLEIRPPTEPTTHPKTRLYEFLTG